MQARSSALRMRWLSWPTVSALVIEAVKNDTMISAASIHTMPISRPGTVRGATSP